MDELWVWTMDDEDGNPCVAYVETAGGTKVPCLAPTRTGAEALIPVVTAMSRVLQAEWTLRKFTKPEVIQTIAPT
jgi:hypothetical protein